MKPFIFLMITFFAITAHAYTPVPVQRSEGEMRAMATLAAAQSDSDLVRVGVMLLETYPDDIPAGRMIQQRIGKLLDNKIEFFKERYEQNQTLANFYLYARATDFHLPDEQVAKVVDQHPDSFWAWLMYMATEWHKENPDMAVVLDRVETAVMNDPARPEGYDFLALVYLDLDRMSDARATYEAGIVCDPENISFKEALLNIYLIQRDAEAYFKLVNGILPAEQVEIDLASLENDDKLTTQDLRGRVTLLIYWSPGSDICINNTLVELNEGLNQETITFPVYAMQLGGGDKALIKDTDKKGKDWKIQFMHGSQSLDKQLGLPTRPCVYVIGEDGFVHAIIQGKGHRDDLVETVVWLAEQVKNRM